MPGTHPCSCCKRLFLSTLHSCWISVSPWPSVGVRENVCPDCIPETDRIMAELFVEEREEILREQAKVGALLWKLNWAYAIDFHRTWM